MIYTDMSAIDRYGNFLEAFGNMDGSKT